MERNVQLNAHCWRRQEDSMEKNITCLENNSKGKEAVRERGIERQRGKRCRKYAEPERKKCVLLLE